MQTSVRHQFGWSTGERYQNPFLTARSTQIKSVISVPIKDFIHHYPRALFNDIPRVGAHFYDIPGSGRSLTTYPGQGALSKKSSAFGHCSCTSEYIILFQLFFFQFRTTG